jgi:hypothetical protein
MDSLIGSAVSNDVLDLHVDIFTGETRNLFRLLYPSYDSISKALTRCRSSYRRFFVRCSEDTIVLDSAIVKMGVYRPRRQSMVFVVRDIGAYSRYWSCTSPSIPSSGSGELSCAFNALITVSRVASLYGSL